MTVLRARWVVNAIVVFALCAVACTSSSEIATVSGTAAPPVAPIVPPASVVVFMGDSLTSGQGVAPTEAWPLRLSHSEGWEGHNLSCGGAGFSAVGDCGRYQDMITEAIALQPVLVLVPASSNDLGADRATLEQDTARTLTSLRAGLPNTRIVGISAIWNDGDEPEELTPIDAALANAVTAVGGRMVSIGEPVAGHPELVQNDSVHFTGSGYDTVAKAVEDALRTAGITS